MEHREGPIGRAGGPLAEFAAGLRALHERAGSPPYEVLARKTGWPAPALSMAAGGQVMPSLQVTLAYVRACGGDSSQWEVRWRALSALVDSGLDTPPHGLPVYVPPGAGAPPARDGGPGDPQAGHDRAPAGGQVDEDGGPGDPPVGGRAETTPDAGRPSSAPPGTAAAGRPEHVSEHGGFPDGAPGPLPWQGGLPAGGAWTIPPHPALDMTGVRLDRSPFEPAGRPPADADPWPAVRLPSSRPEPPAAPSARTAARHRTGAPYRRAFVLGGSAVALTGAVLGAWIAFGDSLSHPRQASRASMPMPRAGNSVRAPGAGTAPSHGAAPPRGTATASPSLVGGAAVVAGPGCPASSAASGAPSTGAGGDGWIEVGGGPGECGGHALATFTTTGTGTVQDTYTWRFRTGANARCTLRLFIPDTNPSSASAHYDVYGAAKRLGGFTVVQAAHKGQWVEEGTWIAFSGVLRLRLTDQADYPGAHHHVTASAADASCR